MKRGKDQKRLPRGIEWGIRRNDDAILSTGVPRLQMVHKDASHKMERIDILSGRSISPTYFLTTFGFCSVSSVRDFGDSGSFSSSMMNLGFLGLMGVLRLMFARASAA